MNFYQYLLAIQEGKVINFKRFLTLLPEPHKQRWRDIFRPSNTTGRDIYNVTIIDQACFCQLLEVATPSNSRAEAAIKGNSHQHNSSMSFVLVFPDALNQQKWQKQPRCPEVVVCDNTGLSLTFKAQKTLLVIENQENFFRYQEFITALSPLLNGESEQIDIAFGHGNSITNRLHADFFAQYQHVLCCFDYDLGGLTMFSTLLTLFESHGIQAKATFIQPSKAQLNNNDFLTAYFKKTPEKVQNWQQAILLANQLNFSDLANAFNRTKKFMEQEVYLSRSITEFIKNQA